MHTPAVLLPFLEISELKEGRNELVKRWVLQELVLLDRKCIDMWIDFSLFFFFFFLFFHFSNSVQAHLRSTCLTVLFNLDVFHLLIVLVALTNIALDTEYVVVCRVLWTQTFASVSIVGIRFSTFFVLFFYS